MFSGILGLSISFVILAAIVLWIFAQAKIHKLIKISLIPIVIWYGTVLFITSNDILGFPSKTEIPDGSIILSNKVNRPTDTFKGNMCFWVLIPPQEHDPDNITLSDMKSILTLSKMIESKNPRAYEIPYDEELHKQLLKAQKEGGIMVWRNLKGKGGKKGKKGGIGKPGEGKEGQGERGEGEQGEGQEGGGTEKNYFTKERIGFQVLNPSKIMTKENVE